MRTIYIFILLVITPLMVHAHPWKPQNYIVIDTDGGIDDYRTICLLLSAPNVRVLAITASAGVLDAEKTAYNVKALLNSLHHEGIPVASGHAYFALFDPLPAARQEQSVAGTGHGHVQQSLRLTLLLFFVQQAQVGVQSGLVFIAHFRIPPASAAFIITAGGFFMKISYFLLMIAFH